MTGSAAAALYGFLAFYITCIAVTWFVYTRPDGVLHDIERGGGSKPDAAPQPA